MKFASDSLWLEDFDQTKSFCLRRLPCIGMDKGFGLGSTSALRESMNRGLEFPGPVNGHPSSPVENLVKREGTRTRIV